MAGRPVQVQVRAWVNAQPGAQQARPLRLSIVVEADSGTLEVRGIDVRLDRQDERWEGAAVSVGAGAPQRVEFAVHEGPAWGPEGTVDVTLELDTGDGVQTVHIADVPVRVVE